MALQMAATMVAAPGHKFGSASEPALSSKGRLKEQIRSLVSSSVRERAGPSFEERLAAATATRIEFMKQTEKEQWDRIREARENGERKSQNASPIAAFLRAGVPPNNHKQEEMLQERKRRAAKMARDYRLEKEAMRQRLNTREPLFRVAEVAAAQAALREQAAKRKRELKDDERKRWEQISEIERSVLGRPLLMDLQ
eukprot:TRINITY_DN46246_c0_g1_i1.p2 TRINITY_DN46246_c0_g1~~TRINITY_DN46246_c0_g1_i1.p2  ORF type:complete len:197 (+),score=54.25 TRINITY_DN46246_c0_g1_i1:125-715(+)